MNPDKLKELNHGRFHEVGNISCDRCEDLNYEIGFPIRCPCGGLIHCDSWGYADDYEGFSYYTLQCDKCGKYSKEFGTGDAYEDYSTNDFLNAFLKEIKEE